MDDNTDSPTIQIPLSRGKFAIIDECDRDLLAFKWSFQPAKHGAYAIRSITNHDKTIKAKQITQQMHRIILGRILGRPVEKGELCDHVDMDGLNNTRANLRLATFAQNGINRRLDVSNKSGYKGVYLNARDNVWVAAIKVNDKSIYLGRFTDVKDAAKAYNEAAVKNFGEFAYLNPLP